MLTARLVTTGIDVFSSSRSVKVQVVQVIEAAFCTCAAFADSEVLITGSSDHTVRLWRLHRGNDGPASAGGTRESSTIVTLSHIMRVHTERVCCVAASRAWSAVASGSKDGSAALWDLNRGLYVRSIWHGEGDPFAVHLVAINESTVSATESQRTHVLTIARDTSRAVLGPSSVYTQSTAGLWRLWISLDPLSLSVCLP